MKRSILLLVALFVSAFLALSLMAYAQQPAEKAKPAESAKLDRIDGRVQMINKDTSTITVRERRTNASRQIVYSADTKFTAMNKPGSLDEVKEGVRVIALGKFEGVKLMATRIDVRTGK